MPQYDTVLIRYGELSTKGKNKKDFIKKLNKNLMAALSDYKDLEFKETYDRIYIKLNNQDPKPVCEIVKHIFGISSFSLTQKVNSNIEDIVNEAFEIASKTDKKTFKVVARRHDKRFPMSSDEINRAVATKILQETDHKVDVHNPDFKIFIEVQEEFTYITSEVIPGALGYPVGVNGRCLVLLSGGIDSPVATYYMMKRGLNVDAIHFAAPPYTSNQAKEKVYTLAEKLCDYQPKICIHVIAFTKLQKAIYDNCPESYAITIMRRMMMRIANEIAKRGNCLCLATGESIGQVASQTLESISVINTVSDLPIIRPIVCFDKTEIIDVSKRIGTYDTSILPYEDCCTIFDPKNPVTKPHLDKVEEYESKFDWQSLVDECVNTVERVMIRKKKEEDTYL